MESKLLRQRARENLRGMWPLAIGVALVAALLGGVTTDQLFLPQLQWSEETLRESYHHTRDMVRLSFGNDVRIGFRNGILGFAAFLLGGTIQLGYARFLLKQHDGSNPQFGDLFSQFDNFGTGFAQALLRNLYTFLWGLLLFIPGIVKSLSYAMTPYILAENPNLTASQAIDRSKEMMDGHKMDLFILFLTFFGWDLLAALTMNIGYIFLNPYKCAAEAAFYRQLQAEQRYTTVEF